MGLSANEFRKLAHSCIKEAEISNDVDGKQMLLDIARLYTQTALHIEAREARSLNRGAHPSAQIESDDQYRSR
jgi:hypothetical protein